MNIQHEPFMAPNAKKITLTAPEIMYPGGITISVPGFQANPADRDDEQVFIEIYDGKLQIHVWNGKEDPTTIVCKPCNPDCEIKAPTLRCPTSKEPCEDYDKCHKRRHCPLK